QVEPVPTPRILAQACFSKAKLLLEHGLFWRSLGRGLLLLLRGQLPQFREKLQKGLAGPSYEAPQWYDAHQAYEIWQKFDRRTDAVRERMRREGSAFEDPPLISILMPVYNVKVALLRQAIDSVLRQIYPHWELCIADDASSSPRIPATLEEYT